MQRCGLILLLGVALSLTLSGCGKGTSSVMERHDKLFESADPTAKPKWDKAMTAMQSHDYLGAMLALESMHSQTRLTHEQVVAIDETLAALLAEMTEAARRGNTNARQALEEQRKMREPGAR